tara:strand:- start:1618 stop:2154 length:537 start_codon:yes stop_codon:yes gene_type:complete
MKKIKLLELLGEGGSVFFEQLILEGQYFYRFSTSEDIFEKELNHNSSSPLYHSFRQAVQESNYKLFFLSPGYINKLVHKDLIQMYNQAKGNKSLDSYNLDTWEKALGINNSRYYIDEIQTVGLNKEDAHQIYEIISKVKLNKKDEAYLEQILQDPFSMEGGGPGIRTLILMLANHINN